MIKLENVSKRFITGSSITDALLNINLEILENEFISLVGPSGSGKSTLLNLLGGLDTPTEGKIFIRNKNISEYDDSELSHYRNHEIGFVFQEFYLEPSLSVRENILLPKYFNSSTHGSDEYADKLIREVDLEIKRNSLITEISGGQKQRTAIARALINKPKILLADEPTGNLDLKTGQKIIELLKEIHQTHKVTLIIATHDENLAKLAKRTIKLIDGKITEEKHN